MNTVTRAALFAKVEPEPNSGCWLWAASLRPVSGYGQLRIGASVKFAHRVSYALHRGPIPAGLFVCHHCDTPSCVNPDHLFLGTAKDNAQDSLRKGRQHDQRRTHCQRGHEFTPANTYVYADQRRRLIRRACRACMKMSHRIAA